jgi:hypothetical protein
MVLTSQILSRAPARPPCRTALPPNMNPNANLPNRHTRARQAALRQIAQLGPFIEGSLCAFKRPGCTQPGWHLTFKQRGRTRTLYVPMGLVAEIKLWTRNYRHLKKLIRQVTRHSRALIRGHLANQRAASRLRPSTTP